MSRKVEWISSQGLTDFEVAENFMKLRVEQIIQGKASEAVWLLEHPPIYTAGASAKDVDLLSKNRFPVLKTNRGGQYTYHGPGQRIVYVMLNLNNRRKDVRAFVECLEKWVISTLDLFNIKGVIRDGRVGVWVQRLDKSKRADGELREDKIAAIGIRLKKWVSYHGIAINVEPDLEHFSGIVPCGISGHGITSLVDLGLPVTTNEIDSALKATFIKYFP